MSFQRRELQGPATLGQRLQQLRTEAGLAVNDVAERIHVAPKYLTAIEEGRYQDLPGHVYARNFIKKYVALVQLDAQAAMEKFDEEYAVITSARPASRPLMAQRAKTELPWWRRHFRLLIAGATVALVLVYLGLQVVNLFRPPELIISRPDHDITTTHRSIEVTGKTDPTASVTINRQAVEVADDGSFDEMVDLQIGLNTLRIAAAKPRSQERIVTRQILVEEQ